MKNRLVASVLACGLTATLAACVSKPAPLMAPAVHDLGLPAAISTDKPAVALRRVEVTAAPWLNTSDMQFRFTDARTSERRSFADNRWAATPAQLVEPLLARELGAGAGGECKLSLRLDEFVQLFDGKGKSEVLISGSMSLRGDRVDGVYARDEFDLRQPAASADPAAGVAALRQASDALAVRIRDWLKNAPTQACKPS